MSKKKKTHHDELLFGFRVVDTYHRGEDDIEYESPWYATEAEMEAAKSEYKRETEFDPKGFSRIDTVTKSKY